jgi:hypothetical protein
MGELSVLRSADGKGKVFSSVGCGNMRKHVDYFIYERWLLTAVFDNYELWRMPFRSVLQ